MARPSGRFAVIVGILALVCLVVGFLAWKRNEAGIQGEADRRLAPGARPFLPRTWMTRNAPARRRD